MNELPLQFYHNTAGASRAETCSTGRKREHLQAITATLLPHLQLFLFFFFFTFGEQKSDVLASKRAVMCIIISVKRGFRYVISIDLATSSFYPSENTISSNDLSQRVIRIVLKDADNYKAIGCYLVFNLRVKES